MEIKIEIKTKGKEKINADIVNEINEFMQSIGYKNTEFVEYRICDNCGCILPDNYPEDLELCPNCESGRQDANMEHN
jgi:hypothetical protein